MRYFALLLLCSSLSAQTAPGAAMTPNATDDASVPHAVQVLREIGDRYANATSYRIEAVEERTNTQELSRSWSKSILSAAEAPGRRFRFEGHAMSGEGLDVSDGTTEWRYHALQHAYVTQPVAADSPKIAGPMLMQDYAWYQAKSLRKKWKSTFQRLNNARFLPDQQVEIGGRTILCQVIEVKSEDLAHTGEVHETYTIYIDAARKVIVRFRETGQSFVMSDPNVRQPMQVDYTTDYTTVDLDAKFTDDYFRFDAPASAKVVDEFPKFELYTDSKKFVGKAAPDVKFKSSDGKEFTLASLRGKPVLLDLWATWCAPCVDALPAMGKLKAELKDKVQWMSVDLDEDAKTATEFLKKNNSELPDYHDEGHKISNAFGNPGIPSLILIDADGNVAYFGQEDGVRAAIAKLNPSAKP